MDQPPMAFRGAKPTSPLSAVAAAVARSVPLSPRPWAELGRSLGMSEAECLACLVALKSQGVIRQISAIFDTHALGYRSSLVAARYEADQLQAAAAVVSAHPGVSHNYERQEDPESHRPEAQSAEVAGEGQEGRGRIGGTGGGGGGGFNLWYTLTLPPESRLGLDGTAAKLHELTQAQATRLLPTVKLFKLNTGNLLSQPSSSESDVSYTQADRQAASCYPITPSDRHRMSVLQMPLELTLCPFDAPAKQAGESVEDLLAAARLMLERRQMRRFSAVLHHRQAGLKANVMAVWRVADDDASVERAGQLMAACSAVSHAYQRPTYDDWPYPLYTMIHGVSRQACLATVEQLRQTTLAVDHRLLWSVREFKKIRVRYFTSDTLDWESCHVR